MHALSHLELADGFRMEIEQWGHGERPLVLVHGFTGSRDDWLEQLPHLETHGLTIALDQRGHGGSTNSGAPADYTAAQLTADLLQAFDALGIEQCDLLGHSMGGLVAQEVTLAAPDRVASLILMDSIGAGMSLMPAGLADAMRGLIAERGMAGLADAMEGAGRAGQTPQAASQKACIEQMGVDRFYARIRAKLSCMDPVAFTVLGDMIRDWPGLGDRLAEIQCPTTVLVGAEDAPFLKPAESLAAGIANAEHVVIADAAHSPQLENPEAWRAAIAAHLERARS